MERTTLVATALFLLFAGIWLGQWSVDKQITRVYEDGSFVGCLRGGQCED